MRLCAAAVTGQRANSSDKLSEASASCRVFVRRALFVLLPSIGAPFRNRRRDNALGPPRRRLSRLGIRRRPAHGPLRRLNPAVTASIEQCLSPRSLSLSKPDAGGVCPARTLARGEQDRLLARAAAEDSSPLRSNKARRQRKTHVMLSTVLGTCKECGSSDPF
jgi:hypothetical protein